MSWIQFTTPSTCPFDHSSANAALIAAISRSSPTANSFNAGIPLV